MIDFPSALVWVHVPLFLLALRSRHRVVYGFQARTAKWFPPAFCLRLQCHNAMFLVSVAVAQRHGRWFQLPLYDCFLFARAHHLKNGLEVPLHLLMFFLGAGLDTQSHSRVLVGVLGYPLCTY